MDPCVFKSAEIGLRYGDQRPHPHNCAELYVSLEGRTTDVVNGQGSDTYPLDVFVLTEDVMHGQVNTTDYRCCIFKFDMDALIAYLGEKALHKGFQSIFVIDPALRREGSYGANMQLDPLAVEYAEVSAKMLMRESCGAVADDVFVSLVRVICNSARPREDKKGAREVVAEAVLYMNTHYKEPITLETLARHSGYSARHLTRVFSSYSGSSPMRYLLDLRLSRAAALLSEGKLGVTEVASAVGIGDSSRFSKVFRKRFGMTPSEYAAVSWTN